MIKVRNVVVYVEKPLQHVVSQEITIWATHEGRDSSVGASKHLQQGHYKLLAIDVKIDEEDKALILLSSLPESYDHIVTTMLYNKETLILKEVTSTLSTSLFDETS